MKHTLHRPLNLLALLVVAAVALTAFTAGPLTVARAWPNFTEKHSHSIVRDGTRIHVTAFQRRKMYLPLNTLKRGTIRDQVADQCVNKKGTSPSVERAVHLYYAMDEVDGECLNTCAHCDVDALLARVLSKYGKPQQIATFDKGTFQHHIEILEPEDIRLFMNRFGSE